MDEKLASLDPSFLLSLRKPEDDAVGIELEDLLNGHGGEKPAQDGITIFPEPGFVVKTSDDTGRKCFLNVCSSSKVGLPGGWAGVEVPPEARRLLEQGGGDAGAASELLRFPLSMSPPRTEADHRGEPCTVFDVVFNSGLLRHAAGFRPLKYFLIQLAIGWAEQKHQLILDPQYKLPKMRYKGDAPVPQLLRADAAASSGGEGSSAAAGQQRGQRPLISEVEAEGGEAPALALPVNAAAAKVAAASSSRAVAAAAAAAKEAERPAASAAQAAAEEGETVAALPEVQHSIEYEGRPAERVSITVQLPPGTATTARRHPDALRVTVAGEAVQVQAPGCRPLALELPLAVTAQDGAAELAPDGSSLRLRLPVLTVSQLVAAARGGQQQQAGAEADDSGSRVMELD